MRENSQCQRQLPHKYKYKYRIHTEKLTRSKFDAKKRAQIERGAERSGAEQKREEAEAGREATNERMKGATRRDAA